MSVQAAQPIGPLQMLPTPDIKGFVVHKTGIIHGRYWFNTSEISRALSSGGNIPAYARRLAAQHAFKQLNEILGDGRRYEVEMYSYEQPMRNGTEFNTRILALLTHPNEAQVGDYLVGRTFEGTQPIEIMMSEGLQRFQYGVFDWKRFHMPCWVRTR